MTALTLNVNKLSTGYYSEDAFQKEYKDLDRHFDDQKFAKYIDKLLLEDLEKIQHLFIDPKDIQAIIRYVQYISKTALETAASCRYSMELLDESIKNVVKRIENNAYFGRECEKDYTKYDVYITQMMHLVVAYRIEKLNYKIQKILDHYNFIIDEKKESDENLSNKGNDIPKEQPVIREKLKIKDPDPLIGFFSAIRDLKIITEEDERATPENKHLAEIICHNFNVKKAKGKGFFTEQTLEKYFTRNNTEHLKYSKRDKFKKEFLKILQSVK